MLVREIKYQDYDGNERIEKFYFNLSKAELVEMRFSESGGLEKYIEKIIAEKDNKKIIELFKDLVLKSVGEKSADGRRFMKNDEIRKNFSETEAYTNLFMELAGDSKAAADFVNGVLPKELANNEGANAIA